MLLTLIIEGLKIAIPSLLALRQMFIALFLPLRTCGWRFEWQIIFKPLRSGIDLATNTLLILRDVSLAIFLFLEEKEGHRGGKDYGC